MSTTNTIVRALASACALACAAQSHAQSIYAKPTFAQVERLIKAVDGAGIESMYLSVWDCATGLPLSNMKDTEYRMGDAYIVGNVTSRVDTSKFTYRHSLSMNGLTQGGVYTNLLFSFTNSVAVPYAALNPLITALIPFSGAKDSIPASGTIIREGDDDLVVNALNAHAVPSPVIILSDGIIAHGSDGTISTVNYMLDTVTLEGGSSASGNRRPAGSSYAQGIPSTEFELGDVHLNDTYYYDGTNWVLLAAEPGVSSNALNKIAFTGVSVKVNGTTYNPGSTTGLIDLNKMCYTIKRKDPVTGADWPEGDAVVDDNGLITLSIPKDKYYRRKTDKIAWGDITNAVTCSPFPDGTLKNTTTPLFCESLVLHMGSAKTTGMMYMGTVVFTDSGSESPKRSEVVVTVLSDNRIGLSSTDPEDFDGEVILKVETTSTNNRMRHWMTVYEKFGKRKDVYDDYPRGKISYGGTANPWFGMLFKPLDDQDGHYSDTKLADPQYIAASMEDVGRSVIFKGVTKDTRTALSSGSVLSLGRTSPVYRLTSLSQASVQSLGFKTGWTLSSSDAGVYTWELMLSSDKDISSMTFDAVTYVGNDSSYNPSHAFSQIDYARTTHVFTVRLIYDGSVEKWQIAYNYSFKD